MQLPNPSQAYIPPPKLYTYLLSLTHSVGKGKAKFFRNFGYNEGNASLLEEGLLFIARTEEVTNIIRTSFGIKYIIDGTLHTPVGRIVNIRTVWIIEPNNDPRPRFVTARPRSEK